MNLKNFRKNQNLSQKEVATALGIDQRQLSRYELGINVFPARYIYKLCMTYNISADYLLGLPKGLEYPEEE